MFLDHLRAAGHTASEIPLHSARGVPRRLLSTLAAIMLLAACGDSGSATLSREAAKQTVEASRRHQGCPLVPTATLADLVGQQLTETSNYDDRPGNQNDTGDVYCSAVYTSDGARRVTEFHLLVAPDGQESPDAYAGGRATWFRDAWTAGDHLEDDLRALSVSGGDADVYVLRIGEGVFAAIAGPPPAGQDTQVERIREFAQAMVDHIGKGPQEPDTDSYEFAGADMYPPTTPTEAARDTDVSEPEATSTERASSATSAPDRGRGDGFVQCQERCEVVFSEPTIGGGMLEGFIHENADPRMLDAFRVTVIDDRESVVYQSPPFGLIGGPGTFYEVLDGGDPTFVVIQVAENVSARDAGVETFLPLEITAEHAVTEYGDIFVSEGADTGGFARMPFSGWGGGSRVEDLAGDRRHELVTEEPLYASGDYSSPVAYEATVWSFEAGAAERLGCERFIPDGRAPSALTPPYSNNCGGQ